MAIIQARRPDSDPVRSSDLFQSGDIGTGSRSVMERLPSKRGLRLQQLHRIFSNYQCFQEIGASAFRSKLTPMHGKDRVLAQLRHSDTRTR